MGRPISEVKKEMVREEAREAKPPEAKKQAKGASESHKPEKPKDPMKGVKTVPLKKPASYKAHQGKR